MNYKDTRKTIISLSDLIFNIELMEVELEVARKFNKINSIPELMYNLPKMLFEKVKLECEFRDLAKKLNNKYK